MKGTKLLILVMAGLILLIGTAGYYGTRHGATTLEKPEKKSEIQASDNLVENQKKILKELKILKENQLKIINDLKLLKSRL